MRKIFKKSAIAITILTFLLIWGFSFVPLKFGVLNPLSRAISDFDIYDIVFSQIRTDQNFEPQIVLVNIGDQPREEIAAQINRLNKFHPKVIGLDAIFDREKNPYADSLLDDAIKNTPNFVLVSRLDGYDEDNDTYKSNLTSVGSVSRHAMCGYANLPDDEDGAFRTIRQFRPKIYNGKESFPSFALKLTQIYNPAAAKKLVERNNDYEIINYRGNTEKFFAVDVDACKDTSVDLSFIQNKIVLMGYLGDTFSKNSLEDIFFSPLNKIYAGRTFPDMYGIVIHANIISMILEGNYINEIPSFPRYLFIVLVTFLNAALILYIKERWESWSGTMINVLMFSQAILNLLFSLIIFNFYNLKINFVTAVIAVFLIPTSIDLYEHYVLGVRRFIRWRRDKKSAQAKVSSEVEYDEELMNKN